MECCPAVAEAADSEGTAGCCGDLKKCPLGLCRLGALFVQPLCVLHSQDNITVRHQGQTCPGQISSPRHLTGEEEKKDGGSASPPRSGSWGADKRSGAAWHELAKGQCLGFFLGGLLNMWRWGALTCLVRGQRNGRPTKAPQIGKWTCGTLRINFRSCLTIQIHIGEDGTKEAALDSCTPHPGQTSTCSSENKNASFFSPPPIAFELLSDVGGKAPSPAIKARHLTPAEIKR